ncbi:MAG: hypothetical protein R2708_02250 [Vicinamibacterales bacterium]
MVLVLGALSGPIERFADAWLYAPWAYGGEARRNLTGEWTAGLPDGRSLDVSLSRELGIDGLPVPADGSDATLVGSGRACRDGAMAVQFSIAGRSNRSGSRVRVTVAYAGGTYSELRGQWSGDHLDLQGELLGEPVSLRLRRGRACPRSS